MFTSFSTNLSLGGILGSALISIGLFLGVLISFGIYRLKRSYLLLLALSGFLSFSLVHTFVSIANMRDLAEAYAIYGAAAGSAIAVIYAGYAIIFQRDEHLEEIPEQHMIGQTKLSHKKTLEQEVQRQKALDQEAQRRKILEQEAQRQKILEQEAERQRMMAQEAQRQKALEQEAERKRAVAQEAEQRRLIVDREAKQKKALAQEMRRQKALEQEAQKQRALEQEEQRQRMIQEQEEKARIEEIESRKKSRQKQLAQKRSSLPIEEVRQESAREKAAVYGNLRFLLYIAVLLLIVLFLPYHQTWGGDRIWVFIASQESRPYFAFDTMIFAYELCLLGVICIGIEFWWSQS